MEEKAKEYKKAKEKEAVKNLYEIKENDVITVISDKRKLKFEK